MTRASQDTATLTHSQKIAARRARGERGPLRTGACLAGWHEGSKPRQRNGTAIKTCELYLDCPCKCHTDMDELFKLSDRERELVVNPEYKRTMGQAFHRPTVAAPSMLSQETIDADALVSPAPGVVPGEKRKEFSDAESGRIPKGKLEYLVKQACDIWFIESLIADGKFEPCTTNWVSEQIAELSGEAAPQLGGIQHVFKRWESQGIAVFGFQPHRFEHYTQEAIDVGMDRMREKAARVKKQGMAF